MMRAYAPSQGATTHCFGQGGREFAQKLTSLNVFDVMAPPTSDRGHSAAAAASILPWHFGLLRQRHECLHTN